ncbi:MAG TPA: D-alanyl-D-alanine carboxypeptidase family protein [Patescibacteria group bacterium]|nr:D-alanyl-D-alanine carboxypeptidase family protein [Patescibacteria group bacterium]
MKGLLLSFCFSLLCIAGLFFLLLWLITPYISAEGPVLSPMPSFLTRSKNNQVTTLDIWLPLESPKATNVPFALSARAALSYDLTTNQTLYVKSPTTSLPMASLTKIMTAIVALEHPQKTYTVPQSALVGEDSMGLSAGETLSLPELLYGLILHSGNDAAETLAANFPQGRGAFIQAMNDKVQTLGLTHTHFTNPTGLEGDGSQRTTAYDLLVMTKYALENFPLFGAIAATAEENISQTQTHKAYSLENETNLLTSYPGVQGVKTGYTPEAGLCLVTYLNYGGHQLIAVVLGSDDRRGEMIELLDFSLEKLGITPPPHG